MLKLRIYLLLYYLLRLWLVRELQKFLTLMDTKIIVNYYKFSWRIWRYTFKQNLSISPISMEEISIIS
jgi:hypothetical protein